MAQFTKLGLHQSDNTDCSIILIQELPSRVHRTNQYLNYCTLYILLSFSAFCGTKLLLNQLNRLIAPTIKDCEVFFSALYPGQCLVIPLLLRQKIVDSTLYFIDFVDLYKSNEMNTNTRFGVFLSNWYT